MKLCLKCIFEKGMTVSQPFILKVYKGCDHCGSQKSSYDLAEVQKQQEG